MPFKMKTMNNPKVSVIMAAYNSEKFIAEAIESILKQTLNNIELIIINDASTDNTLNIIKHFKRKDSRIRLINNNKNMNAAKTRNNGLRKAKGEFIAILDSDDISHKDRLKIEYNYLKKNKNIFLIGSSAIFIDEDGNNISKFRKFNIPKLVTWRIGRSCGIIHSTVMFRNSKEFFYNINYPYAQDYNLYLDMISKNKILTNLPNFLVKYRVVSSSISVSKRDEQRFFRDKALREHKKENIKSGIFTKITLIIFLMFFYFRTFLEKRGVY